VQSSVGVDCAKEVPTDIGMAEITVNASASARTSLVNMIILLVLKPEVAFANQIGERGI
jgi:hypothetical protein